MKHECNCGAVDIGVGIMHEPGCGLPEPEEIELDAMLYDLRGHIAGALVLCHRLREREPRLNVWSVLTSFLLSAQHAARMEAQRRQ